MVRSNIIRIVVKKREVPIPPISSVSLTADRTEIYEGEKVNFTATISFAGALPQRCAVTVDTYVNGKKVKSDIVEAEAGTSTATYSFTLRFERSGTYEVYVETYR